MRAGKREGEVDEERDEEQDYRANREALVVDVAVSVSLRAATSCLCTIYTSLHRPIDLSFHVSLKRGLFDLLATLLADIPLFDQPTFLPHLPTSEIRDPGYFHDFNTI